MRFKFLLVIDGCLYAFHSLDILLTTPIFDIQSANYITSFSVYTNHALRSHSHCSIDELIVDIISFTHFMEIIIIFLLSRAVVVVEFFVK